MYDELRSSVYKLWFVLSPQNKLMIALDPRVALMFYLRLSEIMLQRQAFLIVYSRANVF